jgi:hypothetical protein
VTAAGTETLNYQWQVDGFDLPGETGSTLTLNDVQDNDEGDYTVVIYNNAGTNTSEPATLTLAYPPVIATQPANVTVLPGQAALFSVGVDGQAPFSYQWSLNGTTIAGATNKFYALQHATNGVNSGDYQVVVTNSIGSATSRVATLTVMMPPAITLQPTNTCAQVGQTACFAVAATGNSLSYQWHLNNTNLPGAIGPVLTLNEVTTNNMGVYSVTVNSPGGSVTSSNATLAAYFAIITMVSHTSNEFTLSLSGVPNEKYSIQGSSNFVDWVDLTTNTPPVTFTDTNHLNYRFYRGRLLP